MLIYTHGHTHAHIHTHIKHFTLFYTVFTCILLSWYNKINYITLHIARDNLAFEIFRLSVELRAIFTICLDCALEVKPSNSRKALIPKYCWYRLHTFERSSVVPLQKHKICTCTTIFSFVVSKHFSHVCTYVRETSLLKIRTAFVHKGANSCLYFDTNHSKHG